jgi:5-methylcytosine-specific restriction enzyme A
MSRRRYLSSDAGRDKGLRDVARASLFAHSLYLLAIPCAADDCSLPTNDPDELLWEIWPAMARDYGAEDVQAAIDLLIAHHLWEYGPVGRLRYLRLVWRRVCGQTPLHPMRIAWQRIAHRVRQAVFARDGYQCVKCGEQAPLECDHIQAVARGGTNELSNLQTLCKRCNRKKWAK